MLCIKTNALEKEKYLELINVSKTYNGLKAVNNLSLTVYKGDIYGFLGPNGAGKSTSIRMILSLITPDAGKIKLFGENLSHHRYTTLSRVGALIEKPDFYTYLSARKNLEILGKLSGVNKLPDKIDEVLRLVKLHDRAGSKVRTYSQGMRQRLGIAQCLLHDPDLIILDEPGNGLDPQGQKEMRNLIKKLSIDRNITIILSSHILNEIEQVADRMIIINKGKKIVEGKVDGLLNGNEILMSLEVSDIPKAKKILGDFTDYDQIDIRDNKLYFSSAKDQIPLIMKKLLSEDIDIYSATPARTLEDYFIKITS